MGAYLSHPVTDKETWEDSNHFLEYGGASMQGWRRTMEDAHIADIALGERQDLYMFGVFDGHGGGEVAQFCQKYMAGEMHKLQRQAEASISSSLVEVFHKMDEMLREECYTKELSDMRRSDQAEGMSDEDRSMNHTDAINLIRQAPAQLLTRTPAKDGAEDESGAGPAPEGGEPVGGIPSAAKDANAAAPSLPSPKDPFTEYAGDNPAEDGPPLQGALANGHAGPSRPASEDLIPEPRIAAGCTAIVAVIQGRRLYVANAGDSRAVLSRQNIALPLSTDHKPGSDVERDRIHKAGGFISDVGGVSRVNGNLNLSRAIGDLRYKGNLQLRPADQIITAEPDIIEMDLEPGDRFLLLACDGVWDVMTNQEAVEFVARRLDQREPLTSIACALMDHCLASDPRVTRGVGCDNMTITIVRLKPEALGAEARRVRGEDMSS